MIPVLLIVYIDGYFYQVEAHVKALMESQLKEMQSTKVIVMLWVRWKKPLYLAIILDSENAEVAEDLQSTKDVNTEFERLFNSLITEFFRGSNIDTT